jgi:hypothetical protein
MTTETFFSFSAEELPKDVQSHPGMISLQERRLLYGLRKNITARFDDHLGPWIAG